MTKGVPTCCHIPNTEEHPTVCLLKKINIYFSMKNINNIDD